MKFLKQHKSFFKAVEGAFSEVTSREYFDSQLTVTRDEKSIITKYFGIENILKGNKRSNPELALQEFLLYPTMDTIKLNLVFPKPEKTELRLYLSSEHGFKPSEESIWFIFVNNDNELVIGSLLKIEWNKITLKKLDKLAINFDKIEYIDIPKFDNLFQITLDAIEAGGGAASIYAIEKYVGDQLRLSDFERSLLHNENEGNRTELGYRLAWSRNYLKNAGLIENPQRTIWSLSPEGENLSKVDKNKIKRLVSAGEVEKEVKHSEIETDYFNENIEAENLNSETSIKEPFDPKKIDIVSKPMILEAIFKRLKNKEINLLTGFQRKSGLWDDTKQSRLIESILIRFPLPAFYFDGSKDNDWLIVDGLQRITSLKNFVIDKTLRLKNLEFLHNFNGYKFADLPRDLQRRIEEFEIIVYIINPGTPDKVKYNVFKRINTGGLILSSQEIRHALNQGKPANFIAELANCKEFKIATSYSINSDRMEDRNFANRFLAFYLSPIDSYRPDLDTFLNESMSKINELDEFELNEIFSNFKRSLLTAHSIFGDYAFRKRFSFNERRKPINKALFEVWSVNLAKLDKKDLKKLIKRKDRLIELFMFTLNTDEVFVKSISSGTGGANQVRNRFREINQIINKVLSS